MSDFHKPCAKRSGQLALAHGTRLVVSRLDLVAITVLLVALLMDALNEAGIHVFGVFFYPNAHSLLQVCGNLVSLSHNYV